MRLLTIKPLSGVKEAAGRVKNFQKRKRYVGPVVSAGKSLPWHGRFQSGVANTGIWMRAAIREQNAMLWIGSIRFL